MARALLGADIGSVTFTPGAAGVGKLVFAGVPGFNPTRLLEVINITKLKKLYIPEIPGLGGTWSLLTTTGGTLTLECSTLGHGSADVVRSIYTDEEYSDETEVSLEDIARMDGFHQGFSVYYDGPWTAGHVSAGGVAINTAPGQSFYAKTMIVSASRKCAIQVAINTSPNSSESQSFNFYYRMHFGDALVVPLNESWGNGAGATIYTENGDGNEVVVNASFVGYRFTTDQNLKAKRTLLWIGDSIANAGGIAAAQSFPPDISFTFGVRDWINAQGHDYRLILKTWGGATTIDAENWRNAGILDTAYPSRVGVIMYNMGANDYVDPATAAANIAKYVPWALKKHPRAIIVVCGPTPSENNTTEAGIATVRANFQAYVNGLANSRVSYLNLGNSFDRTVAANYSDQDTPGFRIHPSIIGMAQVQTVITNYLNTISIP